MAIQWTLLLFGLLAGIGLGCLGIASISSLMRKFEGMQKPLLWSALALIVLGGICSFFHLNNPAHLFYVLGNMKSGITVELVLTALSFAAAVGLLLCARKESQGVLAKVIAVLGIAMAIVMPFATGNAYSVMVARPAWATVFLPIMYLIASWAGGLLVAAVLAAVQKDVKAVAFWGKMALGGIAAFLISVMLWLFGVGAAPYQDASRSVAAIVGGDLSMLFWAGPMVLGTLLPALLAGGVLALSRRNADSAPSASTVGLSAAALLSFVAGSAVLRCIVYLVGTSFQAYIYTM